MYHVVFNCDDNYVKYTAVLISNIIQMTNSDSATINYPNKPYYFHILSDFISQDNINKLHILQSHLQKKYPCEIKTYIIDNSMFKNLNTWGFNGDSSLATYYRILIDKILPKDIEKLLYIDTDMLVLCDIRELFTIDLHNKVIASNSGTLSTISYKRKFISKISKKTLKIQIKNYFCAGLMLINMTQWREQNIESKCIKFLQEYVPEYNDQDALNYFVQDSISLEPIYGIYAYQYIESYCDNPQKTIKEYKHIFENIKIIHCNGPAKAWSNFYFLADSKMKSLVFDTWWHIAQHDTDGFTQDFIMLRENLKNDELRYCTNTMAVRLREDINRIEYKLWKISHPIKALCNFTKKILKKIFK